MTSSKNKSQNTLETFDRFLSTVKTSLGYLCLICYQKWKRLLNERTVSINTIQSLPMIRTAVMYMYILFKILKCGSPNEPAT